MEKSKKSISSELKYCDIKKLIASKKVEKWWENAETKTGNKWTTLRHNGVLFPPEYEPLPSKIKILYKGSPVKLDSKNTDNKFNITAEEAAVFFAMKMEQDDRLSEKNKARKKSKDDKKFVDNFWHDWKIILGKDHEIKNFKDVDFTPLQRFISSRSEEKKGLKKSLTKEEKKLEKEQKEEIKELYGYAIVDGVKIPLGSYVIQPPGLFIGHGQAPLRGKIKARISPKDITLNVSKDSVPRCFNHGKPCRWGNVIEDNAVTWIASWKNPITEDVNYVFLKREASEWVCASDMEKFEKARNLAENIEKVRKIYTKDLSDKKSDTRQLATAVYLLDVLAIRPGTEKDETKEAGTLGLTTLKCENIQFGKNNNITIDFIGKSSIHFSKTFKVESKVYENLQSLCLNRNKKNELFPDVNAISLNNYLKTLLPNLTAKVFRTYKASSILQKELNENVPKPNIPTHEKKLIYDKVNIEVAKALNHKKLGTSDERIEKLKLKIKEYEEKAKISTTDKQKQTAKKNIEINKSKLEEAMGNISTSTSKVNYLDPRITVSWCKSGELPIEKIYNKTQLVKFVWAMETPSEWKF